MRGNRSVDASHGIDITDEESSDLDVSSTSLAAQCPRGIEQHKQQLEAIMCGAQSPGNLS